MPGLGTAFGALAASIRAHSLFLSTFQDLVIGTAVVIELSLPDGPAIVDGVVVPSGDAAGMGIAVELEPVDATMRERLAAASSMFPPAFTAHDANDERSPESRAKVA